MNVTERLLDVNHAKGRMGVTPDCIVIHVTEGSAASVRSWFGAREAQVSAHYMVCVTGAIDQFVAEDDVAWHAGRVDHPTAALVLERPTVNPNTFSIGVEHEGTGLSPMTDAQRAASLALLATICTRWGIPMDRRHIVGHHEIYSKKTCPGAIDVDALVTELHARNAPSAGRSTPPVIVWSEYARDWLVVVRVASDTDWDFIAMSAIRRGTLTHATVPLSAMPLVKP